MIYTVHSDYSVFHTDTVCCSCFTNLLTIKMFSFSVYLLILMLCIHMKDLIIVSVDLEGVFFLGESLAIAGFNIILLVSQRRGEERRNNGFHLPERRK